MRYFLAHEDDKVLIIVPTTSLVKQMYGDFCKYADNDDDWFATENCHEIMAGLYKYHNTKRVIYLLGNQYIIFQRRGLSSLV